VNASQIPELSESFLTVPYKVVKMGTNEPEKEDKSGISNNAQEETNQMQK
jgi:hypothetical protein